MMERRRSTRSNVEIDAVLRSGDKSYPVILENVSEDGLCLETESHDLLGSTTRFSPGNEFELVFNTPSDEELKVHCRVIWSFKLPPQGLKRKVGLETIFPPPSYIDFCKSKNTRQ